MPDFLINVPDWRSFKIEQSGSSTGHCDCCGFTTRRVWGLIHREHEQIAAYFVGWTESKPDHGATFDLILGRWGERSSKEDRYAVALDFRIVKQTPQFMVVEASDRVISNSPLVGTRLKRADVIGTPLAPQVFAMVDAVYMAAELDELRSWSN